MRRVSARYLGVGTALIIAAVILVLPTLTGRHLADFDVYRRGGHAILHGLNLYSDPTHRLQFTYPPFAGVVMVPFAAVPVVMAGTAMVVLSILASDRIAVQSVNARALAPTFVPAALVVPALVLCVLCTEPVRITVALGQINAILVAAVLADFLGAFPRLPRGVLLGLTIGIKLTPAVFVVFLLCTGRRRTATTAVLTFAATVGVGVLAQGHQAITYWTSTLWDTKRVGSVTRSGNQSILATAARTLGDGTAARLCWVALSAVVVLMGIVGARRLHAHGNEILAVGVVGVVSCLVSPIAWSHHWVWCLPVFGGLLHHGRNRSAWALPLSWLAVFEVGPNTPWADKAYGWSVSHALVENDYVIAGLALVGGIGLVAMMKPHLSGPPARRLMAPRSPVRSGQ